MRDVVVWLMAFVVQPLLEDTTGVYVFMYDWKEEWISIVVDRKWVKWRDNYK